MVEKTMKDEEVFKHFNEVRREDTQIANLKDLLQDNQKEKIFAIKRFGGKGIILKPLGALDKELLVCAHLKEIRAYEKTARQLKTILSKKPDERTEEDNNFLLNEVNSSLLDFEIAFVNAIIKEPKMSIEQTKEFMNSLTEEELAEFITITSKFFNLTVEEIARIKNW